MHHIIFAAFMSVLIPATPALAMSSATSSATPSANIGTAPAPSITLDDAEIERIILDALSDRHVDTRSASLEFSGQSARLTLPADAVVSVERLTFTQSNGRFAAVISARTPDGRAQRMTAIGRMHANIDIPVLNRRVDAGEVIRQGDVQWVAMQEHAIPANAVYEPRELVGFAPRRSLRAGTPVTSADLVRPVVVAKGSVVMLVLRTPTMLLTARGRALENGAIGETIRVSNDQSRTVVSGVVLADGQVAVDGTPPALR
ncbi:MAG: flagellar basal body P-ring formation protein FlgA [Rhodospirillales bacterium]|nr:flagellar basal body P-ring formation protein FlgA [Rhodospirillales bacterium]